MKVNNGSTAAHFFATHPVFRVAEFAAFRHARGTRGRATEALLAYHAKTGRVLRIRRGLYASVPLGGLPENCDVDPFLIAGRVSDDAVLAYHTALEFHGKAHSVHQTFLYLTRRAARPFSFRGSRFRGLAFAAALKARNAERFGVATVSRAGIDVRVTRLERTLVDVLDRPQFAGGWEEIWRSLESVEFFDLDQVVEYALLLDNATTAAKVGFYLEQHRKELMVQERHLDPLRTNRPQKPHYLSRSDRKPGRLVAEWNLVVPEEVLERRWQEVA
jgi:predicted transcriptional regulator of viral defense system